MLGTRPQLVGVFLLRWPQHRPARSTCAPVRLPPTCAPRHSAPTRCASPGTALPTRSSRKG
eukprot:scaffold3430_cov61-Phaeocystis_antarctica.AAC.2